MVLVTHKLQGSYILFSRSSPAWSHGLILRRPITTVRVIGKNEKHLRLKQTCHFSLRDSYNGRLKAKPFRVTSFKRGIRNNDSRGSESGTKVTDNSVKLSYLPDDNDDDDDENNVNGSTNAQNTSLSYTSETNGSINGQLSIQKLFKKWLKILHTESPAQAIDGVLEEQLPQMTKPETQTEVREIERDKTTDTVWSRFWNLDSAIKIPLLLFVPGYVAVYAIYGAEVTKELMPLWVGGPLVVALYIKLVLGLCALYAFCFKQSVKIIRNSPAFILLSYNYIIQGRLKDDVLGFMLRPWLAIKNMDYKKVARSRMEKLQVWIIEKYLDFVESVWPHYCRAIRFLKRANLI